MIQLQKINKGILAHKQIFLISWILLLFGCQSNETTTTIPLSIDTDTVADKLTLFGEGVISTSLYERDLAITSLGEEIIYTLGNHKQTRRCLIQLTKKNGAWKKPRIMSFSGKYQDIEPFYANNGNRLFFASNRPIYNDNSRSDYNIWYSDRIENGWADPIALDTVINTRGNEFFPSVSDKGTLFFTATRNDGMGREDIFMSKYTEGKFAAPSPLPTEINTTAYEFNAYVSPEEDLIVFSSFGRSDGMGGGDLYMSRKDNQGRWTKAVNMGETINSDKLDFCPFIDWRSRNFYFTSERVIQNNDKLQSTEDIISLANSTVNGFGNIYKIGLDQIEGIN